MKAEEKSYGDYFKETAPGVLAAVVLLCLITSCCLGSGTSSVELIRVCAEACGPAGMQSWSSTGGCVCRPEPEVCLDVD